MNVIVEREKGIQALEERIAALRARDAAGTSAEIRCSKASTPSCARSSATSRRGSA